VSRPTNPSHDFDERVRPVGAALLGYVRRCLHHAGDAEDVLQTTLLRALESYHRFDPDVPFRVAVFRIATDEVRNANRRRKRDRERNPELDEAHDTPAPDVELEMVYERVLQDPDWVIPRVSDPVSRAVSELGDNQRAALVLRAVADLPCADVAAILGAPKGTVLAWLHRARAHLRRRLAEHARSMGWEVRQP
jgi:RNA polymerase sigma-70 factor (ECF subfamily)